MAEYDVKTIGALLVVILTLSGAGTYYFQTSGYDICVSGGVYGEWLDADGDYPYNYTCAPENKSLLCWDIRDYGSNNNSKCLKLEERGTFTQFNESNGVGVLNDYLRILHTPETLDCQYLHCCGDIQVSDFLDDSACFNLSASVYVHNGTSLSLSWDVEQYEWVPYNTTCETYDENMSVIGSFNCTKLEKKEREEYTVFKDTGMICNIDHRRTYSFCFEAPTPGVTGKYDAIFPFLGSAFIIDPYFVTDSSNFINGTFNRTLQNASGFVQINTSLSNNGSYTSKVFDGGVGVVWDNISFWKGDGGERPTSSETDTNNVNTVPLTTDATYYYRMNETEGVTSGINYTYDYSGNGNNATLEDFTNTNFNHTGKFGRGLKTIRTGNYDSDGVLVPVNSPNVASVAWWYNRTSTSCASTGCYMFTSSDGGWDAVQYYWSNATHDTWSWKTYNVVQDTIRIERAVYTPYNQWVHIVMTWNDTANERKFYANGELVAVGNASNWINSGSLKTWYGHKGSNQVGGVTAVWDEITAWNNKVLTATEVKNMYRRGVVRLNLSVRNCSSTDCSGTAFTKLGGGDTFYNLSNFSSGQYFQYKFDFETDNVSYTPELWNVTTGYIIGVPSVSDINVWDAGCTAFPGGVCNTTYSLPPINFTTDTSASCAMSTNTQNFTTMNASNTQCFTTGGTSHFCYLHEDFRIPLGESTLCISCINDATGDESSSCSAGPMTINRTTNLALPWHYYEATTIYEYDLGLKAMRIIWQEVIFNTTDGPSDNNSAVFNGINGGGQSNVKRNSGDNVPTDYVSQTFEFVFKPRYNPAGWSWVYMFKRIRTSENVCGTRLRFKNLNQSTMEWEYMHLNSSGSPVLTAQFNGTNKLGVWQHVVVSVREYGNISVWIDNVKIFNQLRNSDLDTTATGWGISSRCEVSANYPTLNGSMDYFKLWYDYTPSDEDVAAMFNASGLGLRNVAPNQTLTSPINGTNISTNYILLNSTYYDPEADLGNCTFYADTTADPTTNINLTTNIANNTIVTFNYTSLSDNTYYWKVGCLDNNSAEFNTSVWNFLIDTTLPTVNLFLNDTEIEFNQDSINVECNASDDYLKSYLFNITFPNGTAVFSTTIVNSSTTLNSDNLTVQGTYDVNCYVTDYSGNFKLNASSFVVNHTLPPTVNTLVWNVSPIYTTTDVSCQVNVTNLDTINANTTYYVNGVQKLTDNNNILTSNQVFTFQQLGSGNFSKGDTVNCSVITWDSHFQTTNTTQVVVSNTIPSVPVLSSPADTSIESDAPVLVKWLASTDDDGDSITYYIYGDSSATPTTIINSTSILNYSWGGLADGNTYYWKVKSGDGTGNSSNSSIWSFLIDLDVALTTEQAMWLNSTYQCLINGIGCGNEFYCKIAAAVSGGVIANTYYNSTTGKCEQTAGDDVWNYTVRTITGGNVSGGNITEIEYIGYIEFVETVNNFG